MRDRLLSHVAQPARELLPRVGEDLADRVVGVDVAELLVGRPLRGVAFGLARAARCARSRAAFATCADVPLEVGEPGLDRRIDVDPRRRLGGARRLLPAAYDLRVGVLDLLEPARRLDRAAVVVGMVELGQPPVGRAKLLVRDVAADAQNLVRIARQGSDPGPRPRAARDAPRASDRTRAASAGSE